MQTSFGEYCRFSICTLMLLAFASSCEESEKKDPSHDCIYYVSTIDTRSLKVVDAINYAIDEYSLTDDIVSEFKQAIMMLKLLNLEYEVSSISYNTVDPWGKPIVASGLVYFPKNAALRQVVEISPISKNKSSCGSNLMEVSEAALCMFGNVIIIPDLIGFGITDDLPVSYLMHDNVARVSADMRKAAEEFILCQYDKQISSSSVLFGYSLGGSGALALLKFYQEHPEYGVSISQTLIGSGVYDTNTAIDFFIREGRSDYAIIPCIIQSIDKYYNLSLDYDSVFIGTLLENHEEWCSGIYSPIWITEQIGTDMHNYMHPDFFSDEGNTEIDKLMNVFRNQTLVDGWAPQSKIILYHGTNDYIVPVACSDLLYENIKAKGANVEYHRFEGKDHYSAGYEVFKNLASIMAP